MQLGKEEARRISEMTLSEKLGQMFVTGFPAEEMDESFRALVKDKKVGNVILFKDNLKSAEQIVGLSRDIRALIYGETGEYPLITLTIFTFNGAWNNFLWPLIINTRSSMNVLTITMATLSSNQTTNYGMVMAGATLTFVFPFLLYVFLQKQFVEGVAMGGVKG